MISIISMLVVGIGTMSLIIVLSVFNGLEGLLRTLYGNFDPDIIVTASAGKSFVMEPVLMDKLASVEGVVAITAVIEDNVLIKYKNAQRVVRMKGVSENFLTQRQIKQAIVYGVPQFKKEALDYAIVGRGVQYDLSINPQNDFYTLQVYYPKNINPGVVDPSSLYRVQHVMPTSVFAIEKYYDENYVFVSLDFAERLLEYGDKRTALELTIDPTVAAATIQKNLTVLLGENYSVKLGEELHEDLYKILKIEKLFVFIIFSLIIGIASINIYFSLTMLAIDKKRDVAVLNAMGASKHLIQKIFLFEGALVAVIGAGTGLILGLAVSFLQQYFGFISMGMQSTVIDAYPVQVDLLDVLLTCGCIIIITIIASIQPSRLAIKKISLKEL